MTALAAALALPAPTATTPRASGACAIIRAYAMAYLPTCRRVDVEAVLVAQGYNPNTVHTQVQAAHKALAATTAFDATARLPL